MTAAACECVGQCGDRHDGGRCGAPDGAEIMRARAEPWRFVVGVYEHRGTPLLPPVRVRLSHGPGVGLVCQRCRAGLGRGVRSAAKQAKQDAESGQAGLKLGGG